MADRLSIYRGALRLIGDARLSSLEEPNPNRKVLDDVWAPAVDYMLEKASWNFAVRGAEILADDDFEPLYGYRYSFRKPEDWVRTTSICDNPFYNPGFERYQDDNGFWFADIDTMYIRYVSNLPNYGWDIGAWRQHFAKALEAYMAFESGLPISSGPMITDRQGGNALFQLFERRLKEAKAKDALDEAVSRPPVGRLVQARYYRGSRFGRDC